MSEKRILSGRCPSDGLPARQVAAHVTDGICRPAAAAAGIPGQHLCDWKSIWPRSPAQAEQQHARVERVFKEAGCLLAGSVGRKTKLVISWMHKLVYKKTQNRKPISAERGGTT